MKAEAALQGLTLAAYVESACRAALRRSPPATIRTMQAMLAAPEALDGKTALLLREEIAEWQMLHR